MISDTIYALATPVGVSGVAVIRISGPRAFDCLRRLSDDPIHPKYANLRRLHDPRSRTLIDEGLVLFFPCPRSFTGEDVVELQVHGSHAVIELLSDVLTHFGCRPADRGEFARRALHNGKLDLIATEALDDLINARDPATLAVAHGQAGVQRQRIFDGWRRKLTELQAACEALIDFPDEDLSKDLIQKSQEDLLIIFREVQELEKRSSLAKLLDKGLEVLLVGPPNSGKSTLLNALAGYDRAIVSDEPGTTRDFVELEMTLGSFRVRFVDTAGLRQTEIEVERLGIQRTKNRLESASLVLNLHDSSQTPEKIEASCPVWNLQTKGVKEGVRSVAAGDPGQFGVESLIDEIGAYLQDTYGALIGQLSFQRERQVFHVKQLAVCLEKASHNHTFPEIQSEHLRQAADALGKLSGAIHIEDVLDQLFSGFCIGK